MLTDQDLLGRVDRPAPPADADRMLYPFRYTVAGATVATTGTVWASDLADARRTVHEWMIRMQRATHGSYRVSVSEPDSE